MKDNSVLILISGSGGVGKNTLINGLLSRDNVKFISSYTTRARREVDSKDQYSFITKQEFEDKIKSGEIFEYDIFNNEYYGTSKSLFLEGLNEKQVVLKDISVLGYENCQELLGKSVKIMSVFLTEKKSVLKQRLIDRGESKEKIKNRLCLYKKEQSSMFKYNFIIKNSNYNQSFDKLNALVEVGTNNEIIYPYKDYNKLSAKKIDKYAFKLESGKQLKPIKVALVNNKIYIVDGMHRYLASLKTGKNVSKKFIEAKNKEFNFDVNEWKKIIEAYDIKKI